MKLADLYGVPLTTAECKAAIEESIRRVLDAPPQPPCGSKELPHLIRPNVKPGELVRCVQCGDMWTAQ